MSRDDRSANVRSMILRPSLPAILTIAAATTLAGPAHAGDAELASLTATDYHAAVYFQEALEHPKVAKLKSRQAQLAAVAKDLNLKPKKLAEAVDKLEALGEPAEIAKKAEAAVKNATKGSRIDGKVLDVLINAEESKHVVMYVRWQSTTSRDVVKEASTIANLVATEAPMISTLSLAAIHPKASPSSKDAVWSGKISAQSMAKIQKARIDDYGDRLYKGLFEGVEEKQF